MTTPDDPRGLVPGADPLDELASAIVDGETANGEGGDDPAVADRVARFRAVAELVAAPVAPPSDDDRDRIIAAALAAAAQDGAGGSSDRVVALRRRRLPAWVPAAAAVAVLVAGIGLLVRSATTDDADEAATADAPATREAEAFADAEESGADEDAAEGGGGQVATTTAAGSVAGGSAAPASEMAGGPDLGDHATTTSLEDALRSMTMSTQDSGSAVVADAACADRLDPGAAVYTARLATKPVVVGVNDTTYVVLDQATCAELATGTL